MPDIKTKGYSGVDLSYTNVPKIYFRALDDSGNIPFTYGNAVSKVVELNFENDADMSVNITEGELVTEMTITKPADLKPENLLENAEIGGIKGTRKAISADADAYIEYTLNENGEPIAAAMYGFTSIPAGCFAYSSKLTTVDLSGSPGITSIGDRAFHGCSSLTNFDIPNSVTKIGNYAFYQCTSLTSIIIPDGVTSIANYMIYGCTKLTSVTIGSGVTSIGNQAFNSCTSLPSIIIPDGVTSIGTATFGLCTKLTSVTIGSGVTSIGNNAFSSCNALTSATFKDTTTWYVGTSAGATTTQVNVTNTSTAATYLRSTHVTKYWTKV